MTEIAKVLRWIILAAIIIVIGLELSDMIENWLMGLFLIPLIFAFLYFWQAAAKSTKSDE